MVGFIIILAFVVTLLPLVLNIWSYFVQKRGNRIQILSSLSLVILSSTLMLQQFASLSLELSLIMIGAGLVVGLAAFFLYYRGKIIA